MGFNKRYLDDKRIIDTYKKEGIEGLKRLCQKVDAFVGSGKYVDLVLDATYGDTSWDEVENSLKIVR
tara:strand:+ start:195 stop:395 length:201 start_codon:yes stop_codon:yes gene_type:complete